MAVIVERASVSVLFAAAFSLAAPAAPVPDTVAPAAQPFPLQQVRLLDGPFRQQVSQRMSPLIDGALAFRQWKCFIVDCGLGFNGIRQQ